LKIAYISSSTSLGGLEMNQIRNATWMQERGHDVLLFCIKDSPVDVLAKEENLPVFHIKRHRKYYDFLAGICLYKSLKNQQITHLFFRDTRDMSVLATVKFLSRKGQFKLVYFMEMQLGVKKTNILHTLRFKALDFWSCPLKWLEKQVHEMTHFDKSKTRVVPSGIVLNDFQIDLNKKDARKILDLPENAIIFGLIGRFDPHKGQILVLEAFKRLKNENVFLCFLGEPTRNEGNHYQEEMYAFINQHQLQDRVYIRPFRKDIVTFYKAVDACLMASKAETVGMVTLESLASGTPVIGSNAGGTPEILKHGEYGILFETQEVSSLEKAMNQFLENPIHFETEALIEESKNYDHKFVCELIEKNFI
jgi:glycosyltransferase involved in cell wall biosynthesis